MNKIYFLILLCLTGLMHKANSQCAGNLFTNGSFNSMEGENVTAPGWIAVNSSINTPDINDEYGLLNTTTGYLWTGIPLASTNGSTWQNLFGIETIEQTVNVTIGQSYTLCFEYAAQGIFLNTTFEFADPVGVNVYSNGFLLFTATDDNTQYTWETSCFSFFASDSMLTIKFEPTQIQYVGIDGACLLPGVNSSTGENLSSDFKVFPNPFSDKLNLTMNNDKDAEFILYDIASRKIIQQQLTQSASLNTDQLAKGIYIYELRISDSVIKTGKIIKE